MVVFERNRPVRREPVFDADADRAAPTGFAGPIKGGAGRKGADRGLHHAIIRSCVTAAPPFTYQSRLFQA